MDDDPMQKAWENARGIIQHEDNLVNHRVTAFLTMQGFLFAGLAIGLGGLAADKNAEIRPVIVVFLLVLCVVGYLSPRLVGPAIRAALRQVEATKIWWYEFTRELPYRGECPFPPIAGREARAHSFWLHLRICDDESYAPDLGAIGCNVTVRSRMALHRLPGLLTCVWLALFLIGTAFAGLQVWHDWRRSEASSSTEIKIREGDNVDNVGVSFEGMATGLDDLERRVKAIPAPSGGEPPR